MTGFSTPDRTFLTGFPCFSSGHALACSHLNASYGYENVRIICIQQFTLVRAAMCIQNAFRMFASLCGLLQVVSYISTNYVTWHRASYLSCIKLFLLQWVIGCLPFYRSIIGSIINVFLRPIIILVESMLRNIMYYQTSLFFKFLSTFDFCLSQRPALPSFAVTLTTVWVIAT